MLAKMMMMMMMTTMMKVMMMTTINISNTPPSPALSLDPSSLSIQEIRPSHPIPVFDPSNRVLNSSTTKPMILQVLGTHDSYFILFDSYTDSSFTAMQIF